MAELATIARPYAEAAFRLASDDNALPQWSEMLRFLATIVSGMGRNFVRVLVEADRVSVLPEIARLFDELKADAEGVAQARIETAFPLDDAQVREITTALERRFGKKIEAT